MAQDCVMIATDNTKKKVWYWCHNVKKLMKNLWNVLACPGKIHRWE